MSFFFIDDLLLRSLGIIFMPFDLIWLFETIRDYAVKTYSEERKRALTDELKEVYLIYELGEMNYDEFNKRKIRLLSQLKKFEMISRLDLENRVNLLP
jgi:hypothetical protein